MDAAKLQQRSVSTLWDGSKSRFFSWCELKHNILKAELPLIKILLVMLQRFKEHVFSFLSLSNIRLIKTERNVDYFLILSLSLKITRGGIDSRKPNMHSSPKDRCPRVAILWKGKKWRIMITEARGPGQRLARDSPFPQVVCNPLTNLPRPPPLFPPFLSLLQEFI